MRYVARPGTSIYIDWEVLDTKDNSFTVQSCSESEAKIIVFSLNAIAEGKLLATTDGTYECETCQGDTVTLTYDGPVNGIAPDDAGWDLPTEIDQAECSP